MPTFRVIETLTLQYERLIDADAAQLAEQAYGEIVTESEVRREAELIDAQVRTEEVR